MKKFIIFCHLECEMVGDTYAYTRIIMQLILTLLIPMLKIDVWILVHCLSSAFLIVVGGPMFWIYGEEQLNM